MKSFFKGLLIIILVILALAGAALFWFSYRKFVNEKQAEKEEEAAYYKEIAGKETDWILSLMQDNGAVLLYESDKEGEGSINPYFACEAMIGVISDKEKEHVEAAGKYLKWHTEALLEEDGIISDYKIEDGEFISKGKSDSFDSYAAEYLLLLAKYIEADGDLNVIGDWEKAVTILSDRFEEVSKHGVTYTSSEYRAAYLMDNTEVWNAVTEFGRVLSEDEEFKDDEDMKKLSNKYLKLGNKIGDSIENKFWLSDDEFYTIALTKDGDIYGSPDLNEFYPDAIAQLYPAMMEVRPIGEREQDLYQKVCDHHSWEYDDIAETTFYWTEMSYAAVIHGDFERMDTYLDTYNDIVEESRKYPLHTASAGWIIRACNKRADIIMAEENTDLVNYIKWLKGEK